MFDGILSGPRASRFGWSALVAVIVTLGLAIPQLTQAIPSEFTYQAQLTDSAGTPVTSTNVDVTIDLYDGPST